MTETFRSLHRTDSPLVLANAWDAASARIAVAAGAPAVATTSAGVSWTLGRPDGGVLGRDEALAHLARIVRAVRVPVTGDIEDGFGATPGDVAQTLRAVVGIGAAGVNIEDAWHGGPAPLRDIDDQCARLASAREAAGPELFINARIDTYLRGGGDLAETIERANAYADAGADGIFVPGPGDAATIRALAEALDRPLNILVGPGSLPVKELAELGVARVSLGSSVAEAAYAAAQRAMAEAYATGTYSALEGKLDYMALNGLLQ
jgi:2-methylisocitrate lyase-like PEP mutase family enzyme